uniref:Uncharacterized protein n=1 Tax=Glossina austeni TaxID=7395 RepID=A0A1A9VGT0_GLOAU
MLFENPAVAAKLPFPYNVPPPLQAAAAAAAAVPNLRYSHHNKLCFEKRFFAGALHAYTT